MKHIIITSCTGEKSVSPEKSLTFADFQQGAAHVRAREQELEQFLAPAGQMYTGDQHVRLMRGVSAIRAPASDLSSLTSDLWILSAGYGLIPEDRIIAPYECTFATMKRKAIRAWADTLNVPSDFRSAVAQPYDFGLILLGDNYLQACQLDTTVKFNGFTILFCGQGPAKNVPRLPNLRVVTLSNPEAKRFSCGLVGLKGELAARLLKQLSENRHHLLKLREPGFDVLALLDKKTVKEQRTASLFALNGGGV